MDGRRFALSQMLCNIRYFKYLLSVYVHAVEVQNAEGGVDLEGKKMSIKNPLSIIIGHEISAT